MASKGLVLQGHCLLEAAGSDRVLRLPRPADSDVPGVPLREELSPDPANRTLKPHQPRSDSVARPFPQFGGHPRRCLGLPPGPVLRSLAGLGTLCGAGSDVAIPASVLLLLCTLHLPHVPSSQLPGLGGCFHLRGVWSASWCPAWGLRAESYPSSQPAVSPLPPPAPPSPDWGPLSPHRPEGHSRPGPSRRARQHDREARNSDGLDGGPQRGAVTEPGRLPQLCCPRKGE